MAHIIGIDLGTTNSVVAVLDGTEPRVLINEEGQRVTPSVVAFDDQGAAVAGAVARRQAITNPLRTVSSVKRFMGHRYRDVAEEASRTSYEVVAADNGDAAILIDGKRYAPPEIAARILMKLKRAAENALGSDVNEAVITVPAYFNDAQRQATRTAGQIAGLDVKRIINEPTAAALSFGLQSRKNGKVVVYDFGGGTFDVSVLEISDDVVEVVSTAGDTRLGGDDIDRRIMDRLLEQFLAQSGIDASSDRMVLQRLRDAAERAKIELSAAPQTEIHLPFLAADASGPKHLTLSLTRSELERMVADLVGRTIACCERALEDAGLDASRIEEVLLVGGSTRIPIVQDRVEAFFGRKPNRAINPDEAVALGAAVQGGILSGSNVDILLLDVTPLSLGLETRGGITTRLIERNTTIPTRATKLFSTAVDGQTAVEVHVLQGEREFARENRSLGRFELTGIPKLLRGEAKIEVTFDIDANGIVSVSAVEKTTDQTARIRITDAGGVTDEQITRMIQDAESAQERDRERREAIETRNVLEAAVHRVNARLNAYRESLPDSTVDAVDEALFSAKEILPFTDAPAARFREANDKVLAATTLLEDQILGIDAKRRREQEGSSGADEATDDGPAEP